MRVLLYTLLCMLGFILLYVVVALALSQITLAEEQHVHKEISIYVMSNGVHTDIVLPVKTDIKDWRTMVAYKHTRLNDTNAQYLAFGWGDRKFYMETPTWADLKFSTAFSATFGLGKSALHTTYYNNVRESEKCKKVELSKSQYMRLVHFIDSSFKKDKYGRVYHIPTTANYGNNDAFYEAQGSYSLFKTCNTWTNNALKTCGLKACLWTPFEKSILLNY